MEDELSVSLTLDTSKYQTGIQSALKDYTTLLSRFDKIKLSPKIDAVGMRKMFSDIQKTGQAEYTKLQSKYDNLQFKIDFEFANANELKKKLTELKARRDAFSEKMQVEHGMNKSDADASADKIYGKDVESLSNAWDSALDSVGKYQDEQEQVANTMNSLEENLKRNPFKMDFDYPALMKFNTEADNLAAGMQRDGSEFEGAKNKVNIFAVALGKVKEKFAAFKNESKKASTSLLNLRIGHRILMQIRNSIATALNPLNAFRKAWNAIINDKESDFGYTFKNIKNNLLDAVEGPIKEIAQWIINLIGYANIFLKIWSGGKIDLFKKSARTAKEMEKSMSKTTASFDEINDISGSDGKGPDDFSIMMPELDPELESGLGALAKKIQEIAKGIAALFEPLISYFTSIDWSGGFLTGLTQIDWEGIGNEAVNLLLTLHEQFWGWIDSIDWEGIGNALGLGIINIANFIAGLDWGRIIGNIWNAIVITIKSTFSLLWGILSPILNDLWTKFYDWFSNTPLGEVIIDVFTSAWEMVKVIWDYVEPYFSGIWAGITTSVKFIKDSLGNVFKLAWTTIKAVWDVVVSYFKTIWSNIANVFKVVKSVLSGDFKGAWDAIKNIFKNFTQFFQDLWNGVKRIFGGVGSFFIDQFETAKRGVEGVVRAVKNTFIGVLNKVIDGLNKLIKGMNKLQWDVPDWVPIIGGQKWGINIPEIKKIPEYATGANYVPNDQLAVIHQGEAVVPAKFNEDKFFERGNEETNQLLRDVLTAIDSIDFQPYTTVKAVGQASVEYIKETSRALGKSVV